MAINEFCNAVSALGKRWEIPDLGPIDREKVIGFGSDVPSFDVREILARRGIADVDAYMEPSLRKCMPDPYVLQDMQRAVECFASALVHHRRIALLGDYDVDGATSTALMMRYLRMLGVDDSMFYIPQRMTEGYGPNVGAVESLHADGARLLVILDSGTLSFEPVSRARELGMDVIVLDHHEPREDGALPSAIIVNPKRSGDNGSLAYLCTAGLAFLFLVGLNRHLRQIDFLTARNIAAPDLAELLGIVALGTVADVVPLIGLNRAYVRAGLRRLDRIPGIKALLAVTTAQARQDAEAAGRKWRDQPVSARTCGFSLGPCINAAGRIADTRTGTRLLISDDDADVLAIASQLEQLNRERRAIEKQMVEECVSRVEAAGEPGRVIVMFDTAWHPGVVGIAASRVRDRFDRSAVIIGQDGKGSGRSVDGFNIGKAFLRAMKAGLLVKGGGHAAAGGLTIDPAKVPEFVAFMQLAARDFEVPATRIDLVRPVGGLKVRSIEEFRCLEPIGKDNEQPRVVFTGGILRRVQDRSKGYLSARLVGGDYTVEVFVRAEGTRIGAAIRAAEGHYVDMLGEVSLNSYGGKTSVQIKPSDIMVGAVADSYARAA